MMLTGDTGTASLRLKRRRTDADDDALYASILKRAQVAELQPACNALLNEQLTKAHGAVQIVAAAMQRLYEVNDAVEKLKSVQPQGSDTDGAGSVELMRLLNSTESLQRQLSQQLSKLAVPEEVRLTSAPMCHIEPRCSIDTSTSTDSLLCFV